MLGHCEAVLCCNFDIGMAVRSCLVDEERFWCQIAASLISCMCCKSCNDEKLLCAIDIHTVSQYSNNLLHKYCSELLPSNHGKKCLSRCSYQSETIPKHLSFENTQTLWPKNIHSYMINELNDQYIIICIVIPNTKYTKISVSKWLFIRQVLNMNLLIAAYYMICHQAYLSSSGAVRKTARHCLRWKMFMLQFLNHSPSGHATESATIIIIECYFTLAQFKITGTLVSWQTFQKWIRGRKLQHQTIKYLLRQVL